MHSKVGLICSSVFVCVAFSLLQSSGFAAIEDNLELYLELNDGAGFVAADSSGNGRNGAVVNMGGAIDNLQDGDPLPADPLNTNDQYWVSGRFGGGFAPYGAPDVDGDPNPIFCQVTSACTDPFVTQHYAGRGAAMVGANLTNGQTTGGIPDNVTSDAFTYSFHVRMPYNSTYSKDIGNRTTGDDTVNHPEILLDGLRMKPGGFGLSSADTNFWEPFGVSSLDHVDDNRWAWTQVGRNSFSDDLYHQHRGGSNAKIESDTSPELFDVNSPNTLVDGEWHHIVIVQDYSIAPTDPNVVDSFLYVDGSLVSVNSLVSEGSTAADAILGGITLGAAANWRGGDAARLYFDDFALWSRALSPTEIAELSTRSLDSILNNADFNGDDQVDGLDFLVWQSGFGLNGQVDNSNGDANGDGVVDSLDLDSWENQYGLNFSSVSSIATVPEPTGFVVTLIGTMLTLVIRHPK